jgi:hypothetical protein
MKKSICLVLAILVGSAIWAAVAPGAASASTTIEREFRYGPGQFELTRNADGTTQVEMSSATRDFTAGRPDLPLVGERVELPPGLRLAAVEIIGIETAPLAQDVRLPSAMLLRPGVDSLERSAPDPAIFGHAGFVPEQLVQVGAQGFQRGQGVAYIMVVPVRWNPATGELQRVERLQVRLVLESTSERPLERERVVPEWEDGGAGAAVFGARGAQPTTLIGGARRAEPFKATQLPSLQGSPVAYVIVTTDAMAPAFQQLADWKTQCGVPAVVRTLSFIEQQYPLGADDAERVRLFLRDAYSRWGAKWALLGGDTDVIPTRLAHTTYYQTGGEDIATDLYFSCLDGNWNGDGDAIYGEGITSYPPSLGDTADLMPELYVGRAPASTLAEAQLLVDKALKYEREPVADYMNNVISFAEVLFPQNWWPGQSTQLDGAELIDYDLLPILDTVPRVHSARLYENYTDARWRVGAIRETRAAVVDSLNRGYNIVLHVGHGYRNVMSVGDDNLTNADATGLTNGDRLTNLYAINCNSTAIDYPCIAEAFMKAPHGGTVSIVGSTRFDFPTYGRQYKKEFFKLLYQQNVTAVGEAQTRQKLPFAGLTEYDGVHRWTQMALLLLGDPELHIYTDAPHTLSVVHPSSMPVGDSTLTVNVTVGGLPLDSARVTVYRAQHEYATALTDVAGNVTLAVRPDTLGAMSLTVTGFNCRPYRASVSLVAGGAPALAGRTVRIDDSGAGGTSGNADGIWDAGETIALYPMLRNNGGSSATSLSGSLLTTDGLVTILQPAANYGTIAAGDSASPSTGLRVSLPFTAEDQREVAFELRLSDGAGRTYVERFQVTVRAPELRHYAHVMVDAGGNNDGRPDPGETVNCSILLRNLGTGPARTVTGRLRSLDGLATVTDSIASWGDFQAGEERTGDAFTFTPTSTAATFMLVVSDQYGERLRQTMDIAYPATPTGLQPAGEAGSIKLTWTPVVDPGLLGYNVYRATASAGPFVKVTPVPTDRTAYFLDDGLAQLTRYYHRVSSVDQSGNESALSAVVSSSTNPPMHAMFPFQTRRLAPAPVAVDHIYPGYAMDIVTGSDVLYLWHADGSAPVDADGSQGTPGDFTTLGAGTDKGYWAGPTVADLDGGTKEIIGSTWDTHAVYVFDLAGQSKPGWPVTLGDAMYSAVAAADLQGDGQKELVVGSNGYNIYALRTNGTELMDGDSNPTTLGVFKHTGAQYNYGSPALAPLQNDGTNAIVYGASDAHLYAWRYDGSNLPGFPVQLAAGVCGSPAVGSLDGAAGPLSIVVPATCDSVYVFRADGSRRTGFPAYCPLGATYGKHPSPALADMNGDGYLDIVQASTDGRIFVWDGNGAIVPPWNGVRYSTLTTSASECSPVVADINGDGHPDIVTGDANEELSAFSGADASVLPGFPIRLAGELVGTPAVCDCDGDGKTEIVANGLDLNVYMWDYDFTFSPGQTPPWPQFQHDAARTGYAGTAITAGAEEGTAAAPRALELALPAPNPARGGTRLWYGVPADRVGGALELAIYDLSGRRVRTVLSGRAEPGRHSVSWDLRDASGALAHAGVYFARLSLGGEARSQKLVVVH